MPRHDRTTDEGGDVTTLTVSDLSMASDFYAYVFDAEIVENAKADLREMKIGDKRFLLKLHNSAPPPHDPFVAEVDDADVCVARGATSGGTIVDAVAEGPDRRRTGALRDPFGLSWRVTRKA